MGAARLIYLPYDSGRMGERFGRGPLVARDSDLAVRLGGSLTVSEQLVTHGGFFPTEATVGFDLARRLSRAVCKAMADGAFPVVIAGNCLSSLGTVAGMGGRRQGVIWFDAHPDFNTPDTTTTGFLDGMATAVLAGEAWLAAAGGVAGFRPVARPNFVFIGARDIDPEEGARLADPPLTVFSGEDVRADRAAVEAAIAALGRRCDAVYLHLDMDVTEPLPVPANEFAVPGGLDDGELWALLDVVAAAVPVRAAGVTAYDPGLDPDASMRARYLAAIERLARLGAR